MRISDWSSDVCSSDLGDARTSVDFRGGVDTSDATKITYTTPNFSGFSLGVSYTPDTVDGNDGNDFARENHTGYHDNIGVGLGNEGELDGFGLEAGLIGAWADADGEPEDDSYRIAESGRACERRRVWQ